MDATSRGKTRFKCGQCGQVLSASTTAAGKVVACPCGKKLRVPGAARPQEVEVLEAVLIDDEPVSTPTQMQSFDSMHSSPAAPALATGHAVPPGQMPPMHASTMFPDRYLARDRDV